MKSEGPKPSEAASADFERWIESGGSLEYPDLDLWIEDVQMYLFLETLLEIREEKKGRADDADPR